MYNFKISNACCECISDWNIAKDFLHSFLELQSDDVYLCVLSLLILPFCSFTMVVIREYVCIIIVIVIITTELWICEVYFQLVGNLENNKKTGDLLGLLKNSMCLWLIVTHLSVIFEYRYQKDSCLYHHHIHHNHHHRHLCT